MYYVVPSSDMEADRFFLPLSTGRTEVLLPLERNRVAAVLLPVARWLSWPSQRGTKEKLLWWINMHLSILPMADAVARWPALASGYSVSICCVSRMLVRETPQFVPHLEVALAAAEAAERTARMESRRAPAWWSDALTEAPAGPHVRVRVLINVQAHDGHCSDEEAVDFTPDGTVKTVFLPPGDWDFSTRKTWAEFLEDHQCGASCWWSFVDAVSVE